MGRKNSTKKDKKGKQRHSQEQLLTGSLDVSRSGMGFVTVDGMAVDILIRPADFNTALHGDTVRVGIKEMRSTGKRMQGVVKEVLKRKRTEFIGRLQMNKGFAFFIAAMDKAMPDIYIPLSNINNAKDNDRVVVKLIQWDSDGKRPVGEVINILDEEDSNDSAMKEILLDAGFPLQFSDEALEIAARIPEIISSDEINKRKDVRNIFTITIDPVDAKDFDDAISFQKLKNGNYEIGVHIADVSHYLEIDTELDKDAYLRATSVYLPDRVNPMLPEHISNVLCSLRPKEDKLTFSAIFQISPKAEVKKYWLGKTVIHSDHRFTYEEVQAIIEEKAGLHAEEILILNDIAQRFRKKRFNNGAINFSSQEVRFKLNEKGDPIGIMVKESKEAHQLIEEFMLLANRSVAENISKIKVNSKPLPFPYRTHDDPDEEKLVPFAAFAKKFGHKFDTSSPGAIAKSFNQLLADVHGKPEQHVLEQLGIRTMSKAKYTIENVGHYGLGFEHYCHFTSPIRRYPDVQVHRILSDVLNNKINPDKKLEEKCKHTSERERAAMEAERASNKYKQVQYMKNYLGDEFEGVISGVASFGFWVETIEHKCEGLVSVNSLMEYDEFRHIESDYCLMGRRSGKKFRMGDKVWIKVVAANLTKRQLDYEWVVAGELTTAKNNKEKDKKKKIKSDTPHSCFSGLIYLYMQSFELLSQKFTLFFDKRHFPYEPSSLYDPNEYFLQLGGKRIRPVLCLMGNELFGEINEDTWHVGTAIELFHNFTLIHDDIMDKAPLRRGMETVHTKYGENTALLAGDVMLVTAYEELNKIGISYLQSILSLFNKTAKEVCEGQQMDMDFEKMEIVSLPSYLKMIELKTSVALAASLKTGAILGGALLRNQNLLYEYGRTLGIAFQVQDDYLDAFGDPKKFGKQVGGDILANKKTFLLIHALETASPVNRVELHRLLKVNEADDKVEKVLQIYKDCKADKWALELKNKYMEEAFTHLDDIAVLSKRKFPLKELAHFLVQRDY